MKKLIVLLLTVLTTGVAPALAQLHVDHSPKLKIGVTAGLNITQMSVERSEMEAYVARNKSGFLMGPTLTYINLENGIGADASLLFDLRGAERNSNTPPIKSHTVQVPVNFRYGINVNEMVYPFVFVGPQFGLNVGKKEQVFASGTGKTTGHPMSRLWVAAGTCVSLNFGIGIVAMEHVQARVSYNLPLTKTGEFRQRDLETGRETSYGTGKMGACQIQVSYLF